MAGNLFTESCSDWKEGTFELFKVWASKQFGLRELETDDEAEVPVRMRKAKNIHFEKNDDGVYILGDKIGIAKDVQRTVRGYIGAVYSESLPSIFIMFFTDRNNRRLYRQRKFKIPLHSCQRTRPNHLFHCLRSRWIPPGRSRSPQYLQGQ